MNSFLITPLTAAPAWFKKQWGALDARIIGWATRGRLKGVLVQESGLRGRYLVAVEGHNGPMRRIDGRTVAAALGSSGWPRDSGLKRYNLTLDEITIERAAALGAGNISEGVRKKFKLKGEK